MGGIDLLNMCSNLYKYHVKSRRWYMHIFYHTLTLALVNSWFLYRRYHESLGTSKKDVMPLKKFQAPCAQALTSAGKGKGKRKSGRPSLERCVAVPRDVQRDEVNHMPIYDTVRQRCKLCPRSCAAFSYIKCEKYNAHLCLNKERNCFCSISPINNTAIVRKKPGFCTFCRYIVDINSIKTKVLYI